MIGAMGRSDIGDAEVDAFVDSSVVSFAAWDLVAYLVKNPGEAHTLPELMRLLSRGEADLQPVLERLTSTGVLVATETQDGGVAYGMADDPAIRGVASRFVSMSTRREYRLEFVRRVLGQITGS